MHGVRDRRGGTDDPDLTDAFGAHRIHVRVVISTSMDEVFPIRVRERTSSVPSYYLIPVLLVIMSLAIVGLIYWGGFIEERRNGRARG